MNICPPPPLSSQLRHWYVSYTVMCVFVQPQRVNALQCVLFFQNFLHISRKIYFLQISFTLLQMLGQYGDSDMFGQETQINSGSDDFPRAKIEDEHTTHRGWRGHSLSDRNIAVRFLADFTILSKSVFSFFFPFFSRFTTKNTFWLGVTVWDSFLLI